jgi:hypothetical protein
MPIAPPKLDERSFEDLVGEAHRVIDRLAPEWTDRSLNDPGIVLVEIFAHLTDVMLYRLNRLPVNAYIEFLRLVGVKLQPPSAAGVRLRFSREQAREAVEIPRGTRVTIARANSTSEAPVFTTADPIRLGPGEAGAEVMAFHADLIEGELAGVSNGLPGASVTAKRPPIVAPTGDGLDLVVGVELAPEERDDAGASVIAFGGKTYRIWREVDTFALNTGDGKVYVADRLAGTITFAPSARTSDASGTLRSMPAELGEIPPAGRQLRLWYRRGGGAEGNVVAGSLTVLKDAIRGVSVTNPAPATGGRAAESLENAMIRAPQELHSLERAVTARDFERVAIHASGAIARARAFTSADVWRHAQPGTVEVLMVPHVPEELRTGAVTDALMRQYATPEARLHAQQSLDERRPLGTRVTAGWVRYKTVRVRARVVIRRGEDPGRTRDHLLERLHALITPLPAPGNPTGWRFGDSLRIGQVYDMLLAEPGVRYADGVQLVVDAAPDADVTAIARDAFQPRTFYACAGDTLFRTFDEGEGWENIRSAAGQTFVAVKSHPDVPGLVAAVTRDAAGGCAVHISHDCGETWRAPVPIALEIDDLDWTRREGVPLLLLATSRGLYELSMAPSSVPLQVLVEPSNQDLGFYSVAAATLPSGAISVAVAARGKGGVYLSSNGGRPDTYRLIGMRGQDIRVLAMQQEGPNALLWAGVAAPGEVGTGCHRWRIWDTPDAQSQWEPFSRGWEGGSCLALAFADTTLLAATHRSGVLSLDTRRSDAVWSASAVSSGLPIQELTRFDPIIGLATDEHGSVVLAGGRQGMFRAAGPAGPYVRCSSPIFTDKVTLPETWLFTSGTHELQLAIEGEGR